MMHLPLPPGLRHGNDDQQGDRRMESGMPRGRLAGSNLVFGAAIGTVLCLVPVVLWRTTPAQEAGSRLPLLQLTSDDAVEPASDLRGVVTTVADVTQAAPRLLKVQTAALRTEDDAVRSVITRMLPEASAEEREIWFEQLKGLPPGAVEDLLRSRQDIRKHNSPLWSETSPLGLPAAPATLPPGGLGAMPLGEAHRIDGSSGQRLALQRIERVLLENVLQAQTVGYKRRVPVVAATGQPAIESTSGDSPVQLQMVSTRLDLRVGDFEITERHLDVAIEGPGWFAVKTDVGTGYTRCGRLEVTSAGMLGVVLADDAWPLIPEVPVPAGSLRVDVAPTGEVRAWTSRDGEPVVIGKLELTDFRDAARLIYGPSGCLTPRRPEEPKFSGPPGSQGLGSLAIGRLEKSNVSLQQERQQLEDNRQLQQLLMSAASLPAERPSMRGLERLQPELAAPPIHAADGHTSPRP